MIYFQYIFSKDRKESHFILVLIIFDDEDTFFVSINIKSRLRSFEKNNPIDRAGCKTQKKVTFSKFDLRFVFTVILPATAEKKFMFHQFYTNFCSFSMGQTKQKSYIQLYLGCMHPDS